MELRYGIFVKRQKSGHCGNLFQDLSEMTLQKEPCLALNRICILAQLVCLCGFGITWKYSLEETQRGLKIQPSLVGFPLAGTKCRVQVEKNPKQNPKLPNQPNKTTPPQQKATQTPPMLLVSIEDLSHWGIARLTHAHANAQTSWDTNTMSFPSEHCMPWKKGYEKQRVVENLAHLDNATLLWIALPGQAGQPAQLEPGCCKPSFTIQSTEGLS